ncbi:MAG: methylmalonyl Co-A mutase-associated GTPase MeaB [Pseudomonadota bacterium]
MDSTSQTNLSAALLKGDRRALAKAITLAESTRADDRKIAESLMADLMPRAGHAIRIGLSGVPGAGKSTLIEALGLLLIEAGHKVAVLAIDPTSVRTGGSILGDKTRMERLSMDLSAFIRPSPAGETLGGVARRTRDAMIFCEAAGFDVILIETVGVGQSEAAVADLVDLFAMILAPAAGDELQGIKRGVLERADLVVINKADGDLIAQANHAAAEYRHALALLHPPEPDWTVPVMRVSAVEGSGLKELWGCLADRHAAMRESGRLVARRSTQALAILRREIELALVDDLRADAGAKAHLTRLEHQVAKGEITPDRAARQVVDAFRARSG